MKLVISLLLLTLLGCGTTTYRRSSYSDTEFFHNDVKKLVVVDHFSDFEASTLVAQITRGVTQALERLKDGVQVVDDDNVFAQLIANHERDRFRNITPKDLTGLIVDEYYEAYLTARILRSGFDAEDDLYHLSAAVSVADTQFGILHYLQHFHVFAETKEAAAALLATYVGESLTNKEFVVDSTNCKLEPGDVPVSG